MLRSQALLWSTFLASFVAAPSVAAPTFGDSKTIGNVTIQTASTATGFCGLDFLVTSVGSDHYSIVITYGLAGTFSSGGSNAIHHRGSATGSLITDSGPATWNGIHSRKAAQMMGLLCDDPNWTYSWSFTVSNLSQKQRDYEQSIRDRNQAEVERREREKREREEQQRLAKAQMEEFKRQELRREQDRLDKYRRDNPRCLIQSQADIALCNKWQAEGKERDAREAAKLAAERQRLEQERLAKIESDRVSAEYQRRGDMYHTNPCALYDLERNQPVTQITSTNPQHRAALEAQRKQALAAHEKNCNDWKARQGVGASVAAPMQMQQVPAGPSPAEVERMQARAKAERDMAEAHRQGLNTVREAQTTTDRMQGQNAELQRLLNDMK